MDTALNFSVSAVLPAGGIGERMGSSLPKQFHNVQGKPVLYYSIKAFESVSWVQKIVVPIQDDFLEFLTKLCKDYGFQKVVPAKAGSTRFRSIQEGLEVLKNKKWKPDVVVICDAARPFMDYDALFKVTEAAYEHGAAGVTRPLVSTVLCPTDNWFLKHSLDRTKHVASEMPQAFKFSIISDGFAKATEIDFDFGTECLHIAQKYSLADVKLVQGNDCLWKVTHKKDLFAMEHILKETEARYAAVLAGQWDDALFADTLKESLATNRIQLLSCEEWKNRLKFLQKDHKVCLLNICDSNVDMINFTVTNNIRDNITAIVCLKLLNCSHTEESEKKLKGILNATKMGVTRVGVLLTNSRDDMVTMESQSAKVAGLIKCLFDNNMDFLDCQVLDYGAGRARVSDTKK